ncbi:S1C family serine protease [Cellulomonas hominis]|uniref:S1C family serine protease n=1 Tax=Cellulomonas hominis TaxID=156981 RepID=UPI001C120343|nr:trypsin-like peptidase domain-containing protein [Cellulomonas hominis]MBU5422830.1 S1C family serine protease [Cellulomonas hominis]
MDQNATPEPRPVDPVTAAYAAPAAPAVPAAPEEAYPPPRRSRRRRAAVALFASGAVAAGLVLGGTAYAVGLPDGSSEPDLAAAPSAGGGAFGYRGPQSGGGSAPSTTLPGTGTATGTGTLDATTASDAQQAGVVLVSTVLGYQSAEAAGTGVVLTSDGLVVTNNHVVEGATEITVTIGTTGETYTAEVVGTDATADVAVLQLQGASGLTTVALDDDEDGVAVGDAVTAVGNAEGGGVLLAADGTVTGLDESITTQAEGASSGESLTGLIEVDADVVSGDSGGPLLDDEGEVVGITTAAFSGSADVTGYAIPIGDVLDVVTQIVSGQDTDSITLGYPAFLGVQLATTGATGLPGASGAAATGATIAGVVDGTPAAEAGLTAGDTITAVDGTPVADADALSAALAAHAPGDQVTLTWTTTSGASQSATVTLIAGPAD